MLKHKFVLGFVAAGLMLPSTSQAQLIDPNADVLYHPSGQDTSEQTLTNQIQGASVVLSGAHANDPVPPQPDDFFADTHTAVFEDLLTGQTGIFALDQFNPNRTLNNDGATAITQLQGVLLYFTVQLKSGRQVFDNQSSKEVTKAIIEIGANVNVWSKDPDVAASVNFSASPSVRKSGVLAPDIDDPNSNGFPSDITDLTEVIAHSTGLDKLAVIIDPSDPNTSEQVNEIHVDATPSSADLLAAFTGTGQVIFEYSSSLMTYHQVNSQGVIGWTIPPKYDIEARVVYLYSAIPEPASMSLLAVGVFSLLARRRRKREMPLC